jgi:AraC-like DNA-binding protein
MMSISRHDPPALSQTLLGHRNRVEWHDHDRHQLLYPSMGVISVATRTGTWVVPPLRAIWLPAGQPHAHLAHGPTQLCSVMLTAGADPLGVTAPTLLSVSPLLREVLLALTAPGRLPDDQRARLEAVAMDGLTPPTSPSPFTAAPCRLPEPSDDRLRAIAGMLLRDPGDTRTLTELGQAVGASERTLSRLFRAETQMSFPQWRAQLRLHAALIALTEGATVTAVAHRCGYATPSAFIASFRRAFGDTPGTYRARAGSASVRPKSPS